MHLQIGSFRFVQSIFSFIRSHVFFKKQHWYRPNAAVIVCNEKGQVLLCERADRPGTVQTVQGGIEPDETPEQAARRELKEEIGLVGSQYELKAALIRSHRYNWTPDVQKQLAHTGYRGQDQHFFLIEVPSKTIFNLNQYDREFCRVWWGSPEDLVRLSWSNKRPGVESALRGFGLLD